MPHLAQEAHARRRQRVVFRELQLGREDAPFERRAFGAVDQRFPVEQVVFGDGAGGYAFGGVVGQGAVFLEEAAVGGRGCHACALGASGGGRGDGGGLG